MGYADGILFWTVDGGKDEVSFQQHTCKLATLQKPRNFTLQCKHCVAVRKTTRSLLLL